MNIKENFNEEEYDEEDIEIPGYSSYQITLNVVNWILFIISILYLGKIIFKYLNMASPAGIGSRFFKGVIKGGGIISTIIEHLKGQMFKDALFPLFWFVLSLTSGILSAKLKKNMKSITLTGTFTGLNISLFLFAIYINTLGKSSIMDAAKNFSNTVKNTTNKSLKQAKNIASRTVKQTKDAAIEAVNHTKDAVSGVVSQAEQATSRKIVQATNAVTGVVNQASNTAKQATTAVTGVVNKASNTANKTLNTATTAAVV